MRNRLSVLIAALCLAGCAAQPIKPPTVVKVPVYVPVKVASALTEPCPIAMPANRTVAEAVRIARARRASLEACNGQLKQIRDTH